MNQSTVYGLPFPFGPIIGYSVRPWNPGSVYESLWKKSKRSLWDLSLSARWPVIWIQIPFSEMSLSHLRACMLSLSRVWLCDPMDYSPPSCSVHGILQAGILEWQWHPTAVLLPGKSHGWRSLVAYSPWGHKESDMTKRPHSHGPSLEVSNTSGHIWLARIQPYVHTN